ncbi:protein kinase [Acidobacteriota bacterium]
MIESISHFRIIRKIGKGGMGEVYQAEDRNLNRVVAIKLLPSEISSEHTHFRRFVREAKAASALNHRNVCTIYEADKTKDGRPFIVMEYVDGGDLDKRLEGGSMPVEEIVNVGIQITSALNEAHAKGIVHRDIKPGNIVFTQSGEVKILDFGLAKLLPRETGSMDRRMSSPISTESGMVVGTVPFMSPEQLLGKTLDGRSDIFSLGVVLYMMATEKMPFDGDTQAAVADEILNKIPVSPTQLKPGLPLGLEKAIVRALEKDRDVRYQTAADMRADLLRVKRDSTQLTTTVSAKRSSLIGSRRKRRPWLIALAALLAVVLAILAIPQSRHFLLGLLSDETVLEEKHIAVLSFQNPGKDPKLQILCDGLGEYLSTKLTQLRQAKGADWIVETPGEVRAREITTTSEARGKLGVNLTVEGSVFRDGEWLRITLNLIDAITLKTLRVGFIEERADEIFLIQDEVVIKLAEMLEIELKQETVEEARDTTVPTAMDFYLQGCGYLQRYEDPASLDSAVSLFKRALEDDPEFALAYAGLGETYLRKYNESKNPEWLEPAASNCEQAVALNDTLGHVHVSLGLILTKKGQHEMAMQSIQRSLELEPRNSDAYRARAEAFEKMGRLDKAEEAYKKAISLQLSYWAGYSHLGAFYFRHQRYEEAVEPFLRVTELTPDNVKGFINLGAVYMYLKQWSSAQENFEASIAIKPNYTAYSNLGVLFFNEKRFADAAVMYEKAKKLNLHDFRVYGNLASAYYRIPGERAKAEEYYAQALILAQEQSAIDPNNASVISAMAIYHADLENRETAFSLIDEALRLSGDDGDILFKKAYIHEHFNDLDGALEWIEKALSNGFSRAIVEHSPEFEKLREDPRFEALMQRMGEKD